MIYIFVSFTHLLYGKLSHRHSINHNIPPCRREKVLLKQAEIQEKEIERLQATVDKYATASGKKKKMAQDREKKLEK